MINHVRTLLLNRRASDMQAVSGYEYIPPTFFPVKLSRELERIRKVLYPAGLDDFGHHEITAKLVQLVHQPELLPLTLAFDPRITYDLANDTIAKAITNPVTITRYKAPNCDMTLRYRTQPTIPQGMTPGHHHWILSTGNVESIRIQYGSQPAELHDVVQRHVDVTDDIVLVPDYLSVYFDIPSGTLTGDYRFDLDLLVPVPYNFSTILAQLQTELARPGRIEELFKARPGLLDMSTLITTWRKSPETLLRIGAVVLALTAQVQHTMEVRGG